MSTARLEVAKDIVVAILAKDDHHITTGDHDEVAKKVAAVFDVIYDVVARKDRNG